AAGVSKDKERRRETEHRLADTRDNLARLADIRQELGSQIERLEKQAEVARRFNELSTDRAQKQNLLWLLRRIDAEAEAQRHAREIERSTTELESEIAGLREIELELEHARAEHYASGDALSAAQAEQAARLLQGRIAGERERIAQTEQAFQVEQTHLEHAGKTLQGLEQREERLLAERAELLAPDAQLLVRLAQELAQSSAELSRQEALLAQLEAAREALDRQRRACVDSLQRLEREFSALEGRLLTLQKIQNLVEEN